MIRKTVAGLALAGLAIAWPAAAQSGSADACTPLYIARRIPAKP